MTYKWGIKNRVLFLALAPTIVISIVLGVYFTRIRLEDLSRSLFDHGTAVVSKLALQSECGISVMDTSTLSRLAKREIKDEVSGIIFYDKQMLPIASAGKITTSAHSFNKISIANYELNSLTNSENIIFLAPITLSEISNLKTSIAGWVQIELERKSTRLKEYQVLIHSVLIVLLGLSCSSLFAIRMSYKFTKPILELANSVEKIKQGKLETRVHVKAMWELEILESGINTMASSLQRAHAKLQSSIKQATTDLKHTLATIEMQNTELKISRKEAEDANQVKSEFLANMSHELKTPLNSVIGFINLLQKTDISITQKDYLTTMQKSASNLLAIINDILDFSKIETKTLNLDLAPLDIRTCLEDTLTILAPSAHEKQIEIIPIVYNDVPIKIIGDAFRIKQIISNLVTNAIKFTDKGQILIRVMLENDSPKNITLCISVTDTGIGMTKTQQQDLFKAFTQVNPNLVRKFGGIGLGLVICKKLVEQMNGYIDLDSEINKGSTFWFTFQAKVFKHPNIKQFSKLNHLRIAVFEEHPVVRINLINILQEWQIKTVEITKKQDIPTIIKKFEHQGFPINLLIAGINQPLQQRYLVEFILNNSSNCLTGLLINSTEPTLHSKILKMGIDLCLAKPVCRKKLFDTLCKIFITDNNQENYNANNFSLKILAVDDNLANLKILSALLENMGIVVTTATCGHQALDVVKEQQFDLIFMDIHMPDIDGFQTSIQIKNSNNQNINTPIVAITAHVLSEKQTKSAVDYINEYLTKPVNEHQIKGIIYKWTNRNVNTKNNIAKIHHINGNNQQFNSAKFIDWHLCKQLAGGKPELAKDLLTMLIDSLDKEQQLINKSYHSEDLLQLKELIHKLHGACCYVGVPKLKQATKEIETLLNTTLLNTSKADHNSINKALKNLNLVIDSTLEQYTTQNWA